MAWFPTYGGFGLTGELIVLAMFTIYSGANDKVKRSHYETFWNTHHFFVLFFTALLFAPDGKYGAYGGVDDFAIAESGVALLSSPSGGEQPYRRLSLRFDVLTYNQNTVRRRALVSATAAGGSVYVLVASCLGSRFKEAQPALASIQDSFRALAAPRRLRPGPEDKPA